MAGVQDAAKHAISAMSPLKSWLVEKPHACRDDRSRARRARPQAEARIAQAARLASSSVITTGNSSTSSFRVCPPPPLPALDLRRFSISGLAQMTLPASRMDPNTCGIPMP
jgi:hypothetical protein